ncbi:MAG: HEPN domain-containing protein [Firmicutes bacterium]|nr:HEPN domain-containing protein [Bacillota bacterium]
MNGSNDISEWIRLAEMDLATAHHMFKTFHPKPLEVVCFHSQQAAEKIIKCYLVSQGIEPPKIHDMQVLLEMCIESESGFNEIYRETIMLTNFAVRLRYPTELRLLEQDAAKAIENAEKVMVYVKNLLFFL